DQPPLMTVLADTLADWNHTDEALHLYEQILKQTPGDPHLLAGRIDALTALHRSTDAEQAAEEAVKDHSDDDEIAEAVGKSLAGQFKPDAKATSMMDFLWKRQEDLDQVGEALARAYADDTSHLQEILQLLIERAAARPMQDDPEAAAATSQSLVRAARTAR